MIYGFIYYVKNKLTGRMYIGKITAKTLLTHRGYMGSSQELKDDIVNYGKLNFSMHFIATAESGEELTRLEKYYLTHYKIPNEKFYNKNLATSNSNQGNYFNSDNIKGVNLNDIVCYNFKTKETIIFNNIAQFCKTKDFRSGNIYNVMSGQRITHKDCIFWYKAFPLSQDGLLWIINNKLKTTYYTKYTSIDEVRQEQKENYDKVQSKKMDFVFKGYYIEDNKEIIVDFDELRRQDYSNKLFENSTPKKEEIVESVDLGELRFNDRFEIERDTQYQLKNKDKTLYFNSDEISDLVAIYKDISIRILKQGISRLQYTVMSKKYKLAIRGRDY